ncbi:E3 ubiquitin-protein ligase TRIM32 [Frankliniella fusca]|uniref:E3 ubiquitin-protein ligase TRIM32 n=1 Tax=Frankliniella fusca TaxID=407009 RepID=A0AAE1LTW5_9NEOP|nr:E3 ubiquitin-protein ligase TRIM32 [Frankliniella fusca]
MDCSLCLEDYNEEERVPKVLPCGHTVCLQCLRRLQQCPMCRRVFTGSPAEQPNHFCLMRRQGDARIPRGWCLDCRAATARRCWDEHAVLNARAAEGRLKEQVPAGALQEAAALLPDVQCQGEQVLHALTLLSAQSWDLTLRAGDRQLNGTLANTEDPLIKALWVAVASRAALTQSGAGFAAEDDPPPAAARPPAAALDPPPAQASPPREMNAYKSSLDGREQCGRCGRAEKAAALQEVLGVVRLVRVFCDSDPAWSLELLQRAAPTLERLELLCPREPHLRAVHAMPRLQRLHVVYDPALGAAPPELGALPPGHSGLRWLRVDNIPRATLQSLLQAHGGTLEELELEVGTPGEQRWPHNCRDLHSLLGRCGLRALLRLVLRRGWWRDGHTVTACREQLAAVRAALPGVQHLLCSHCAHPVRRAAP